MKTLIAVLAFSGLFAGGCAHVTITAPDGATLESRTFLKDVKLPHLSATRRNPDGVELEFSAEGLSSNEKFTEVLRELEETAQTLLKTVQALQAVP